MGRGVDPRAELGYYDQAVADLERLAEVRPGLVTLARVSYLRELHGDLAGAVQAMAQAAQAGGGPREMAAVEALLGELHVKAGDLDAAGAAFDRAERWFPGHRAATIGRARLLAAQGRTDATVAMLEDLVTRVPDPAAAVLLADLLAAAGRADVASDAGELVRALADLQEAAGQDTDLELAAFEADLGDDLHGAVRLARRAHAVRPDNVYAAGVLAWALHRAGDTASAVPYARAALRLGTADVALRYRAAAVLAVAGDTEAARDALQGALVLSPWTAPRHADGVRTLADSLGLSLPPTWSEG